MAAKQLISKGCQSVLITLGPEGAIYLTNDPNKPLFKASSPKVQSVDTTGAGDEFIGAFAYFLSNFKESTVENCIQAACIVAADSVTRLGTQISFSGPEILEKVKKILHS